MIFFHSRFAALRQLKLVKNIGEFWILADGKAVQNIFCSIPGIILSTDRNSIRSSYMRMKDLGLKV